MKYIELDSRVDYRQNPIAKWMVLMQADPWATLRRSIQRALLGSKIHIDNITNKQVSVDQHGLTLNLSSSSPWISATFVRLKQPGPLQHCQMFL